MANRRDPSTGGRADVVGGVSAPSPSPSPPPPPPPKPRPRPRPPGSSPAGSTRSSGL
ncbi:uncharacterized protein BO72DRAFT_448091 [Aspergillus fijiensis CBS 313.89]|uniref:Uncharacterized protein n=1 Tax=Aspergillus fijiensis CBS 313.89 TaxID=1448319 RepID=A0A8G1RR30_9EURO|nr:uncharacterized protein BO72DRAFT_448091 [Aspergillus fijiensis CBS 313.89]RAK77339.1 hypothetical protein BO72DRAFT_448091 [Aspergillus fijiensis CBS 313.89]